MGITNATSTVMQDLNSLVFRLEDSEPLNVHIRLSNHRFSIANYKLACQSCMKVTP